MGCLFDTVAGPVTHWPVVGHISDDNWLSGANVLRELLLGDFAHLWKERQGKRKAERGEVTT